MYIWIKDGAKEQLAALKEQGLLGEVRLETHRNSGKKYIAIYEDAMDPTTDVPNIPQGLIEKVTSKDRIHHGFRTEGIYRHEGAELMVKTNVTIHSEIGATNIERENYQEFSVTGPSVKAIKAIFTLVRQGKLSPDENWEAWPPKVSVPEPATTSEETA